MFTNWSSVDFGAFSCVERTKMHRNYVKNYETGVSSQT